MSRSNHPSEAIPEYTGPLQLSVDIIKAKEAVATLVADVAIEAPQFELIASNAMRSLVHLERALVDHYSRPRLRQPAAEWGPDHPDYDEMGQ